MSIAELIQPLQPLPQIRNRLLHRRHLHRFPILPHTSGPHLKHPLRRPLGPAPRIHRGRYTQRWSPRHCVVRCHFGALHVEGISYTISSEASSCIFESGILHCQVHGTGISESLRSEQSCPTLIPGDRTRLDTNLRLCQRWQLLQAHRGELIRCMESNGIGIAGRRHSSEQHVSRR